MTNAALGECLAEQMAFVGRAVVGHYAFDGDAMPLEEAKRTLQEGYRARLLLIGQDLGVGEPRCVIDGNVQRLPAETLASRPPVALTLAVAGHAVADAI